MTSQLVLGELYLAKAAMTQRLSQNVPGDTAQRIPSCSTDREGGYLPILSCLGPDLDGVGSRWGLPDGEGVMGIV